MSSGRWPPVVFARGATWPDRRYCRTECGTATAAMCATSCTKQVAVSGLFSKVVQMLRTHAKGSRSTESHAFEGGWDELSNPGQEDVRDGHLGSDCKVRMNGVPALDLLYNLLGDLGLAGPSWLRQGPDHVHLCG